MIPEDATPPAYFTRNSPAERERAAMQVLANAEDRADALELLAQLGLDVPSRTEAAA
ncbi:hypothetical protein AB0420_02180 [Streptomyces caelestis]|uniref:hypothetical protein n=1 Tax=Streptomyces caelestis TaxID=36816 RepID=UPI00344D8D79